MFDSGNSSGELPVVSEEVVAEVSLESVALESVTAALTLKDAGIARVLVEVSPALMKIVDEILQNALDRQHKDAAMKRIDVCVDVAAGRVVVRNDGLGMPVPKPARTNERVPDAYWPTIVCTVDMAGGNFAPAAGGHYSGGRNGIGMKATNILSSFFRFEVGDAVNHLRFVQEWRDGMTSTSEPVVRPYKAARGYVEVTFDPDLAFFGEAPGAGFSAHVAALIRSRVWEIAAHSRAIVTLDGVKLPLRASIAGLASLFRAPALAHAPTGPRPMPLSAKHTLPDGRVVLEVTIVPARDGVPADIIGFVNGIRCNRGAHVEALLKTVGAALLDAVRRKAKRPDMKFLSAAQVRNAMFAVLAVNIDGPAFDHQNKAELDSPEASWGWKWNPEPAFCARAVTLLADDIAATLVQRSEQKALSAVNALTDGSSSRRIVNIAKYEPADNAGCADTQAVLVLTEGDSAMSLAMAGRAVRGSKDMGVFCLKGKPPNPRGKSIMKITDNKVLANVSKILGLEYGRVFTSETDIRRRLNYR